MSENQQSEATELPQNNLTSPPKNVFEKKAQWTFPGGIHPDDKKNISNQNAIQIMACPETLYIPITNYKGHPAVTDVKPGDLVKHGASLVTSIDTPSSRVCSPVDGLVVSIEKRNTLHPSQLPTPTIVLKTDESSSHFKKPSAEKNLSDLKNAEILEIIRQAGIAGLGGAAFPTHAKVDVATPIKMLIINGIECEPYISCDDRLMRERADEILVGIQIIERLVQPERIVFAIEDNKPEAVKNVEEAIIAAKIDTVKIAVVPTKYPSGGEKQLIQILTGQEVPAQTLPSKLGILMHNVGTCYALKRALLHGEPSISRVVTVTGEAVSHPGNYECLIGTPIDFILEQAGIDQNKLSQVIIGGPMMGIAIANLDVGIDNSVNCIIAATRSEIFHTDQHAPCIRCGQCADVCPASLLPQQLFWYANAKNLVKLDEYHLDDCIECGACAYVCPSQIPLVHYYRFGKSLKQQKNQEFEKSEHAKQRFEFRQERLEREKIERAQRHKKAAEERQKRATTNTGDDKKQAIMEALARVKAKQASSAPKDQKTE
ncbi:MAG: electron transport complex subunit RsxC [Pseudomonadota bacterium]